MENIDSYCVLISSKAVYFLKSGDYVDREAIFLEVKYDDLYHCLVSKDHGKVYVQVTKKAGNPSSGVPVPGPAHQKPMVSARGRSAYSSHGSARRGRAVLLCTPGAARSPVSTRASGEVSARASLPAVSRVTAGTGSFSSVRSSGVGQRPLPRRLPGKCF